MRNFIYTTAFIIFVFTSAGSLSSEGLFHNVNWKEDSTDNNVTLYYDYDKETPYYRAETVIRGIDAKQLYTILQDFNNYPDIFPKTVNFDLVKRLSDEEVIIYTQLNFSPMKNRDYYLKFTANDLSDSKSEFYRVAWSTFDDSGYKFSENKNCVRVSLVNGVWEIRQLDDDNVYVSVSYHNDWEIPISRRILNKFEKIETAKALKDLIIYAKENGYYISSK